MQEALPEGWEDFVSAHPEHTLYHTGRWNEMVRQVFRHPVYYVVAKQGNQWTGVVPLTVFRSRLFGCFAVASPYVNYGGPLLHTDCQVHPLAESLHRFRIQQKLNHIELRCQQADMLPLPAKQHKVTFLLPLPAESDQLWKSFKAKVRSQVRRPGKEGMYARVGRNDLLEAFYRVFSTNMRDLGTPVYSRKFFQAILEYFPEQSWIVVVFTREGEPAAASFLLAYNQRMEIPWASSIRKFNRFSPNMLLYWQSMKLAIEQGCRLFDFGRCTPGTGTYRFKKQWGAQEKPLYWYYAQDGDALPELSPQNPKYELAIRLWSRLPVPVTRLLGPPIIRQIP